MEIFWFPPDTNKKIHSNVVGWAGFPLNIITHAATPFFEELKITILTLLTKSLRNRSVAPGVTRSSPIFLTNLQSSPVRLMMFADTLFFF